MPRSRSCLCAAACLALGILAAAPAPTCAQTSPPDPRSPLPERPTVATHAHTIAVGIVELETGIQTFHPKAGETEYDSLSLLKIGVGSHLQFDVFPGMTEVNLPATHTIGVGDVSTGLKWRLLDDAPVVGDFAIQSVVKFPTGSAAKGTGTGTTDLSLLVISSHDVGSASLDVNVGFTARSGDGSVTPTRATLWTMAWGLPVHGRLQWAAEIFGYPGTRGVSGNAPIVGLLTGPTCQVGRRVVIDAGAVVALTGAQHTTAYAGLTWNIGRLWQPRTAARPLP